MIQIQGHPPQSREDLLSDHEIEGLVEISHREWPNIQLSPLGSFVHYTLQGATPRADERAYRERGKFGLVQVVSGDGNAAPLVIAAAGLLVVRLDTVFPQPISALRQPDELDPKDPDDFDDFASGFSNITTRALLISALSRRYPERAASITLDTVVNACVWRLPKEIPEAFRVPVRTASVGA